MTLNISYPEISAALKTYTGQELGFSYKNENTIQVEFTAEVNVPIIGSVRKNLPCEVTIISFSDDVVTFRLDAGNLANVAIKHFSGFLLPMLPIELTKVDETTFNLRLEDVEPLRPLLERLSISGVQFSSDSVSMEAQLK